AFERLFSQAEGRIFVALFGSHLHRVQHALELAARTGRKALVCGRSLERNLRLAADAGCLHLPEGVWVDLEALEALPPSRVVVICTGAQAEPRSALMSMVTGEGRLRIGPKDTVIFSSRTIPGNEPYVTELIDRVLARGARAIYPSIDPS